MAQAADQIVSIRRTIPSEVTLLAVSKYQPVEAILDAYAVGQRDFGESRVQELEQKIVALRDTCPDIRWHFIGHLQTNKIRDLLRLPIALIHSVDSLHLMEALEAEAARQNRTIDILIEVHVALETTKSGFSIDELSTIAPEQYPHLHIRGVMGMATYTEDAAEIRRCFRAIAQAAKLLPGDILSMGMSEDYPIAIEEGSTMIRIGSAIFGVRLKVKS